jgi:hypothetical protein
VLERGVALQCGDAPAPLEPVRTTEPTVAPTAADCPALTVTGTAEYDGQYIETQLLTNANILKVSECVSMCLCVCVRSCSRLFRCSAFVYDRKLS